MQYGLNEANLSIALYYYSVSKKDSTEKYLQNYISNGNGLSIEFAKELLQYKTPHLQKGKTLILYNSIGTYTGPDFNYYLSVQKKKSNSLVKKILLTDTTTTNLVMLNELLASAPQKLHTMQKLLYVMTNLYDNDDIDMCKKVRLTSNYPNENAVLSDKFKKHILIFAPEWHTWLKENRYDKVFYIDMIYQYKEYMKEEEYYNNYIGYYIDVNSQRPYFKRSKGGSERNCN